MTQYKNMHDEDEFEVREEEIIHNRSIASVTEINITHQSNLEYPDEFRSNIFLAKYNDLDTTNRMHIAKQNQLVDAKIKIQFEHDDIEKQIEEVDADINQLQIDCHQLEIKKNEDNTIISEQNVFQKCVEKKLDTKSLIFDMIIPSQIEKQTISINALKEEYDTKKNSWIERLHKLHCLIESNKKMIKEYYNYSSGSDDLTKDNHILKYQEIQSLYDEKVKQQQAQKESITDKQLLILNELSNEHSLFNELINKEMSVEETVLKTFVTQEAKSCVLFKTLEEKKALLVNIQHSLLPSVQSKLLGANNLLQNKIDMKENLKNKSNELDKDLAEETRMLDELETSLNNLDFKNNEQKDDFNKKNIKLAKSISENNLKKDKLENAKCQIDLSLKQYEEEANELLNTTNKIIAETVDAENKLAELTSENVSIIGSIEELNNKLINLNGSADNDIDQTAQEIQVLISDSEKLNLEIAESSNVFAEELRKAENINLVNLEAKLEYLKQGIKSINDKIKTKNIMRSSLTTKVTKLELDIQKLKRMGMMKNPNFHNAKQTVSKSRQDLGILKKIGDKSPVKHVHFRTNLTGFSSQTTTEDVSENGNSELIAEISNSDNDISMLAPPSPPTRLSSKKGKYN